MKFFIDIIQDQNFSHFSSYRLLDAAEAIYKIKHIASSKRIALLERSSLELKECIGSCYVQTEENESSKREVIKNILNKIEYPTFDYLDGGESFK